ncbi:MAG: dephospho-CoA kinase [Opitutales bacterium]
MLTVGLTGGIGSGKSTVRRAFGAAGWLTADADALVRDCLASDQAVLSSIREAFGHGVFQASGEVDRKALADRVFCDARALERLEAILHPRVRKRWQHLMARADRPVLVEIPLLFEKTLEPAFDLTVCVDCLAVRQLERLADRGLTPDQAKARMARQLPNAEKVRRADIVLSNNGTPTFLDRQVSRLIERLAPSP